MHDISTQTSEEVVAISTVTPVYQGAQYLTEFVELLSVERDAWASNELPIQLAEAIFVDDGSSDGSALVLAELATTHPWIRVITLGRNFGQHPATIAGILHSSGDWVVTLDEDLQHRPQHIVTLLLAALNDASDIVYARPEKPVHEHIWYRDIASRLTKRLAAGLTSNSNIRLFNSFRLMRGSVARAASSVSVHDTYFDMLLSWFTDRVVAIKLPLQDQRENATSTSSYTLRKLLAHTRRLVLSARTDYLRVGAALGLLGMLIGLGLAVYTLAVAVYAPERILAAGWTSLFVAVVFFGGLSTLLISILFEYFSTVLQQSQGKPAFFVVDRSIDSGVSAARTRLQSYQQSRA